MKLYYITKSKGRAGCANITYRTGEYNSKAELKREYKWKGSTIIKVYTEDEMTDEVMANFVRWGCK